MIKETLWVGIVILGHRYSESTFDANNWSSWQIESDDNIQKILLILSWDALSRIHAPRKIIKSFQNFDHRPVWIFSDSFATLSWQARFAFLVKKDQFSGHPPPSYLIWLVEYDRKSCLIRLPLLQAQPATAAWDGGSYKDRRTSNVSVKVLCT